MTDLKSGALDIGHRVHIGYNTKYISAQKPAVFQRYKDKAMSVSEFNRKPGNLPI